MMRNLFKVLLVSSALVAVSASSAFATPQEEAAFAVSNPGALAGAITTPTYAGLSAAASACAATANPKACLTNILAAYAQLNVIPNREQLAELVAASGATFTDAELDDFAIAAVTTPAGPATDTGLGGGGSVAAPVSTGPSPSAQ